MPLTQVMVDQDVVKVTLEILDNAQEEGLDLLALEGELGNVISPRTVSLRQSGLVSL